MTLAAGSRSGSMPDLDDARVRRAVREASRAYVAISTRSGPHVTPELFTVVGGRLWFATARRTLKARVTGRRPGVGVLLRAGDLAVCGRGSAYPLDPLNARRVLGALPELAVSPMAGASFFVRNALHLAGFAAQGPASWPRSLATLRILVAVRVEALAVLEGGRLVHASGDWASGDWAGQGVTGGDRPVGAEGWEVPAGVPDDLARLAQPDGAVPAVVGWEGASGPLALPARWDPDAGQAEVPVSLLELAGARRSARACVTVDEMAGYRMESKRGVMLRGNGTSDLDGRTARLRIEPQTTTWWTAQETRSESVTTTTT